MNIIWIGNPFFAPELERAGLNVIRLDCKSGECLGWAEISAQAAALGCTKPDVLVVADKSQPPFVLGMEDFPCLTVLYAVDTHIHSWLPEYAQAFDLCLVSLKDDIPNFQGKRLQDDQLRWFPPYCIPEPISPDGVRNRDAREPAPAWKLTAQGDSSLGASGLRAVPEGWDAAKIWDILFVGTLDTAVNPERIMFLEAFKRLEPRLHYTSGRYQELYPQARLVLNHSVAGDLNFRVFEALGCGAALLTPRLGHGLEDLFTDGEDLFLFDQQDIAAAAAKAASLLKQPDLLYSAAWNGFEKVRARHTAARRADEFLDLLADWRQSGRDQALVKERLARSQEIRARHLKLVYLLLAEAWDEFPLLRVAYLAAATKSD